MYTDISSLTKSTIQALKESTIPAPVVKILTWKSKSMPRGYKEKIMLNWYQHEIFPAHIF